ncbi:hypothetical protein MIMGU_mgv1a025787mg [Erythranthe guttata]|uniref:Uncharacterized protein n=2 Tax=Erythranthe guttata TaxID=4155 RepID=A0A022R2T7_ERYGU|nr:hypothetical protein MIMGU_mgv1a025787mg [Erythranthe guttata]
MGTPGEYSSAAAAAPPSPLVRRSPWQSPVPYLFGGLSAMLGLIAFALLVLACSYWKLSAAGEVENRDDATVERDLEGGEAGGAAANPPPVELEEKYLVIMAGQEKPTFLATPMSSRASSFGSKSFALTENTLSSSEEDYIY